MQLRLLNGISRLFIFIFFSCTMNRTNREVTGANDRYSIGPLHQNGTEASENLKIIVLSDIHGYDKVSLVTN